MNLSMSIWIPLIPFFIFLFLGLAGHKFKPIYAGIIGTTGLFISFILSLVVGYQYFFVEGMRDGAYQQIIAYSSTWLRFTDTLVVSMGSLIDPISVMMLNPAPIMATNAEKKAFLNVICWNRSLCGWSAIWKR